MLFTSGKQTMWKHFGRKRINGAKGKMDNFERRAFLIASRTVNTNPMRLKRNHSQVEISHHTAPNEITWSPAPLRMCWLLNCGRKWDDRTKMALLLLQAKSRKSERVENKECTMHVQILLKSSSPPDLVLVERSFVCFMLPDTHRF